MTNQNKALLIVSHVLCTVIGTTFGVCVMIVMSLRTAPDFPEEIEALSVDYNHPDTLTGYKTKDGIKHFEYLNEQKNK